ncbi:putative membrane protein DUF2157 [Chitinophaga skermanii]|uniref:Putative membrane protein DUF2157 n=1 Tax=Chitinophaga skermanii TaxID=331697 RepID=A0A327QM86_9BACT|nr:DUF2157 domain-containing protein [Chitinophaga skermanii]RAJ05138.1 putative membrane protein DUF2157 [Chitinophaga skermanii]
MNTRIFENLFDEGLVSQESMNKIRAAETSKLFPVAWELRTILYLGVLLLSSGLGILIYKHIDTIGHMAIIALIAAISLGCFIYAAKKKPAFTWQKMRTPSVLYDYLVLLGCLTFVSFVTYLQAQYNVFGTLYGTATFIPLIVLTFSAYYFDHLGVLCMAITNLAAWMGVNVTPRYLITANDFSSERIVYAGLLLGLICIGMSWLSKHKQWKAHFEFTYMNFGVHVLYVSMIAAHFTLLRWPFFGWVLMMGAVSYLLYRFFPVVRNSAYFLVVMALYIYVQLIIIITETNIGDIGGYLFICLLLTGLLIYALVTINRKMKKK